MKKNLGYGFLFVMILAAGCFFFYIFYQETYVKFDQDAIGVYVDNDYWTTDSVAVTVTYNSASMNIKSYSFDGGKTWQESNEYIVDENQVLDIVLKSSEGKQSKPISFRVENIDKEPPKIEADETVYVAVGTTIDLDSIYTVTEGISGLKGKVQITANNLDLYTIGTYKIEIQALNRAMNSSKKTVTIEVVEANDPRLKKGNQEGIAVTGLSVSHTRISLVKGTETTVFPIVKPSNASNQSITWKSSNEKVATVDGNGKITAISAGMTTITATTVDGNKSSDIRVTVTNQSIEVTSIELDRKQTTVTSDARDIVLTAIVYPENATDQTIVWSTSAPNVATVRNGVVTVKGEGVANITATTSNGKVATFRLEVKDNYTFQDKEVLSRTGELMGYTIKVFKNGTDITRSVVVIAEPFSVRNDGGREEIPISVEQQKLIKDHIVIRTNNNYKAYR